MQKSAEIFRVRLETSELRQNQLNPFLKILTEGVYVTALGSKFHALATLYERNF